MSKVELFITAPNNRMKRTTTSTAVECMLHSKILQNTPTYHNKNKSHRQNIDQNEPDRMYLPKIHLHNEKNQTK